MTHIQRIVARCQTITAGETGASLIEYSLLIALIAMAALVAMRFFGGELSTAYSEFGQSLADS